MNPQDDPEARIRQLEQSAADYGAVELGATEYNDSGPAPTAPLPPPVEPYGASPYGAPYTPPQFGVSFPQVKSKGSSAGLVFGSIAIFVVIVFSGIGIVVWNMMEATEEAFSTRQGGGGSVDEIPGMGPTDSAPSAGSPVEPSIPDGGQVTTAPPGGQLSVAGIDENKTVACNDSNISVSGVNNTVTITGHCLSVTVSGVENVVTIDSAGTIGASGFDNQVIYHSGAPEINATGSNVVSQG